MSEYLHERTWLEIAEKGMSAYLTWPKRDEHGHYEERFKDFSNLVKCTRVFVFNDSIMQQIAPSPIFTDGINVYIHEQQAIDCWIKDSKKNELDLFKPVWHGVMRSVEWAANAEEDEDIETEQIWSYIDYLPFSRLVANLQKSKSITWLKKLGFDMKTGSEEVYATIEARKSMVLWMLSQQDYPKIKTDNSNSKTPAWILEADRIVKSRWDDCPWLWEEEKPLTYQRWCIQWLVAEKVGHLIGEARNAMKETGTELKVVKEGWSSALSGWAQTLKAMISVGDWESFGRSIVGFGKICSQLELLAFEEKTEITGVCSHLLEEMPYKMAWVDLLSGSYDFWTLSKILKQDVERFWKTYQTDIEIEEAMVFYDLLPESPSNISFKKEYITAYFKDALDRIPETTYQDMMLKEGFSMLTTLVRGINRTDALSMVEKWRDWASFVAEEWFEDDDDFDSNVGKYKECLEKMCAELCKSRRWTQDEKQKIESIILE